MKKVIVFKSALLGFSETFVKEQALGLKRWAPIFLGTHRVRGVSMDGLDVRLLPGAGATFWHRLYWAFLRIFALPFPRGRQYMQQAGAELVHVHFGTEAVALWPVAKRLKLPLLVTLHGSDINISPDWLMKHGGPFERLYYSRLLHLARQDGVSFLAVSNAIRDQAVALGLPAGKIAVQYIGVDVQRFMPGGTPLQERKKRILFVGRLVEKKGVKFLIQAFSRVLQHQPDAELVVVGDGPLMPELKELAGSMPVVFMGVLNAGAVAAEMAKAMVFCLPSVVAENGDAEGFGLVLLEAQACAVPVITSARGGASEGLVEGETGFAFPEGDVGMLAARLQLLLADPDRAAAMGLAARQFVEQKFDIRVRNAELESLYDKAACQAVKY